MILFLKRLFCRHEKWHRIGLRLAKYDKDVNEFFDIHEKRCNQCLKTKRI